MPKNAQTNIKLCSFHMLARWCSKSFKLGFNSMWTEKFQMYKLDLEKAEGQKIKLPTSTESQKNQGNSRKNINFASLLHKSLCVDHNKLKNSYRDGNTRPSPKKPVCRSRSNSQNWTWNNELVENWERIIVTIFLKEYIKAVYCYPAYLTSMQSYAKCQAGWITSWNQDGCEKY